MYVDVHIVPVGVVRRGKERRGRANIRTRRRKGEERIMSAVR